jgi:hypothetical protein
VVAAKNPCLLTLENAGNRPLVMAVCGHRLTRGAPASTAASDIIGATLEAARQQTADVKWINDSNVPRRGLVSASRTHIQL